MNKNNLTTMNASDICMQLFSEDKSVRAEATKALAALGIEGALVVLPLLEDDNWVVRYRAAEVIGLSGCKEYAKHLLPLLLDEKDHVRYMAVKSLGAIGDSQYKGDVKALENDENMFVVRAVSKTLDGWTP